MGIPRTGVSFLGLSVALVLLPAGLAFSQSVDWTSQVGKENSLVGPPIPALRPALPGAPVSSFAGLSGGGEQECVDLDAQFLAPCIEGVTPWGSDLTAGLEMEMVTQKTDSAISQQAFVSNPEANHPPVPVPAFHRPVMVVYPRDVSLIQLVRTVSVDPAVQQ